MKINKCRGCFSDQIETVIDLGIQPWGNDFRPKDSKGAAKSYPLEVDFCHKCSLLSLNYTVPKEIMFSNHTYVSGSTETLKNHFKMTAIEALKVLNESNGIIKRPKILDIGSNDGTQLKQFQDLGCEVLGVESAKNVASIAQEQGINTKIAYFNEEFANNLDKKFDLISASGVFFHLEELHSAIKAIKKLLSPNGIFVVQFIYLKDMINNGAFDQIYHEHLVYYLFTTLNRLLNPYGLEIFDGTKIEIHGGSGIAYIAKSGQRKIKKRLVTLFDEEISQGFLKIEKYYQWMKDIENIKLEGRKYIYNAISEGKTIYGMGAPVKGNTHLNYFGLSSKEIKYLVEINTMRKNTIAPGSNIPVIMENEVSEHPDIYYCLAWNFRKEIEKRYADVENSGVDFHYPVLANGYKNKSKFVLDEANENQAKIKKNDKILITGSSGLVGSALTQFLIKRGFSNIFPISSKDCNLINKNKVDAIFNKIKPDYVFHIAARTHGLGGNLKYQSDVLYENVMMNTNVINSSRSVGVKKIVAMGSGCVYPDIGDDELNEEQVWLGPPHISQAAYGQSKRLMLADLEATKSQYGIDYVFAISGNIYGPNDTFDINYGNVVPSLIYKFFLANRDNVPVQIWGTGKAIRDFSYSEDIAYALFLIMENLSGAINIGSGFKHKISDIADILSNIYDNKIKVEYDSDKPDGQMSRYYNIDKLISAKFKPSYDLEKGIIETNKWLHKNIDSIRK